MEHLAFALGERRWERSVWAPVLKLLKLAHDSREDQTTIFKQLVLATTLDAYSFFLNFFKGGKTKV